MSSTRLRYLSTQPPAGGAIWGGAGALKKEAYYQEWTLRDQSLAILPVSSLHLLLEVKIWLLSFLFLPPRLVLAAMSEPYRDGLLSL